MLLEKILKFLLSVFLFLLPWQTIWIFRESFLNGVKMEWWTLGFYATEALLWVIILCFVTFYFGKLQVTSYKLQDFKWTKDRVFVFYVLLFIIYHLSSIIWSSDKSLALQQSLRVLEAFLLFLILLFGPLKKEDAIKWLVFGSILPCLLGIWQFLMQSTFASKWLGLALHPAWQAGTSVVASDAIGRWLRAYGSFTHPNVMGGYIVIVLLLTYHITQTIKHKFYPVLCCLGFVFLVALFFTFSRSAWLAAAVVITYHLSRITYQRSRVACYVVCVMCYVFLVTLFFPLVQTRFSGDSILETRSINNRVSGYSEAWEIFKHNPILGVGVGNYTIALREFNLDLKPWEIQPVHNAVVLFMIETGIIGVILCLFVLISFVKLITQTTKPKFYTVLCCLGFVLLLLSDHYLYSSYIGLILSAVFFGLILRKYDVIDNNPQLIHH